jgi:hypothetical protein
VAKKTLCGLRRPALDGGFELAPSAALVGRHGIVFGDPFFGRHAPLLRFKRASAETGTLHDPIKGEVRWGSSQEDIR